MKYFILLILFNIPIPVFSQFLLKGVVKDSNGNPVFAANVYLKNTPQRGIVTDIDGNFSLSVDDKTDTLIVSFIGYNTTKIPLHAVPLNELLNVVIKEDSRTLAEVYITAQDPVSEKFSVVKLGKLNIYLNPVSQGDPLKAITSLPASTTTDESANPSLRGSSADRTRVVLNNVPIYNPVKNSQINGIGNFSIFNAEIINKQYVYASNPPLTCGNTSAGLIEIETINDLPVNQLQLSLSLAGTGAFLSQKIKNKLFVQVFGNDQFSDGFIGINKASMTMLNSFYTRDFGINFHSTIGNRLTFNSFNYFINEGYNVNVEEFTYSGKSLSEKTRFFTVNNIKYHTDNGVLSINNGIDNSLKKFSFGDMASDNRINQVFTSADYKWFLSDNFTLQSGISNDYQRSNFSDSIPVYYFALSPQSPNYHSDTTIFNNILEAYSYFSWDINDKWTLSSGIRSNLPLNNQSLYLSSQLGLKFKLNENQSFLLSGGKYHNYSTPNYYSKKFNLLSSSQIALDYSYEYDNISLTAATYYKNEKGEQTNSFFYTVDNQNTFGIEFFYEQNFRKYFKLTFSNTFINQVYNAKNASFRGEKDYDYFIKTSLNYNNPKVFSLTLSYLARPGDYYTPVSISFFNNQADLYQPIFSNNFNSSQFKAYNRIDISISRYFKFDKIALIVFASLNNILNTKNESEVLYNSDYTEIHFNYYELRTIYFGLVWQLNY
ncbi:MAG: carboxypeptidase-like regulatory domain-containing protein [Bacteroidales bacterium]